MLKKLLDRQTLVFDGAIGTILFERGLPIGGLPEIFGLERGDIVTEIHRDYINAGADILSTNTFQANHFKLPKNVTVETVVRANVQNAKKAGGQWVALDIGPLGQLLEPMGTLTFQEAYEAFRRQMAAGEEAGADLILIETISDLLEMKIAVLAAKENTNLPIFCSMTYQQDGRTFVGCDPITATITLNGLGVDAMGVNCSLGPAELEPVVEQILRYAQTPVLVQANAGLPKMTNGKTFYEITADEYAQTVKRFVQKGVRIIGGCCGTTPDFIQKLREVADQTPAGNPTPNKVTAVTSGQRAIFLDRGITVIGERINPTGKKKMKEALRSRDLNYLLGEAIDQSDAGSDILDVNVGLPEIDEPAILCEAVKAIQSVVSLPLQIDSTDPKAIEASARIYNGKPMINSVNGKAENMTAIFPIVKKYGAVVIGLTLDEKGIPATAQGRLEIARRILHSATQHGIPKEDVVIDCLVLTASAQQQQVIETLKALQLVKQELGLKTVLGISNVSFGLPSRSILNAAFLAAAFGAGLDAPILNPLSTHYMQVVDSFRVLNAQDKGAQTFIEKYASSPATISGAPETIPQRTLQECIIQGRQEESRLLAAKMLETVSPLLIIDEHFIPALNIVGQRFESGELFLPQLMQSAESVKFAFDVIKKHMLAIGMPPANKGKILLATVQGDIHDIGKNIVKMILENYGYQIIDLGKDVPIFRVVDEVRNQKIKLVGLSALMTTTVKNMKETIKTVKDAGLDCAFVVGGAVLNPEYASFVGADFYAENAAESVVIANRFFGHS